MLLLLGNPFKCHEDGLSLQSNMTSPKRFDIFPLSGMLIFFFKHHTRDRQRGGKPFDLINIIRITVRTQDW